MHLIRSGNFSLMISNVFNAWSDASVSPGPAIPATLISGQISNAFFKSSSHSSGCNTFDVIPGGLEPPTSVLQTYALPAATASKCISLVDEMLSYRLLFENFESFIACDKYFLLQKILWYKKPEVKLPLVFWYILLFISVLTPAAFFLPHTFLTQTERSLSAF